MILFYFIYFSSGRVIFVLFRSKIRVSRFHRKKACQQVMILKWHFSDCISSTLIIGFFSICNITDSKIRFPQRKTLQCYANVLLFLIITDFFFFLQQWKKLYYKIYFNKLDIQSLHNSKNLTLGSLVTCFCKEWILKEE